MPSGELMWIVATFVMFALLNCVLDKLWLTRFLAGLLLFLTALFLLNLFVMRLLTALSMNNQSPCCALLTVAPLFALKVTKHCACLMHFGLMLGNDSPLAKNSLPCRRFPATHGPLTSPEICCSKEALFQLAASFAAASAVMASGAETPT